jgi:hypothetical protein
MLSRVFAVLAFVASGLYLGYGVLCLFTADRMAASMAAFAKANGTELDPADWAQHWNFGARFVVVTGVLAVVFSVGMLFRRSWSFPLWACLTTFVFGIELYAFGFSRATYAFEADSPAELIGLFVLALASWLVVWRFRASARTPASAT